MLYVCQNDNRQRLFYYKGTAALKKHSLHWTKCISGVVNYMLKDDRM